jgi:hypothetical protein
MFDLYVLAPSLVSNSSMLLQVNMTFVLIDLTVFQSMLCPILYYNIDIQDMESSEWSRVQHHISTDNVSTCTRFILIIYQITRS